MHAKWAENPASVSGEWRAFFDQLRDRADQVKQAAGAGSWGRKPVTEPTDELGAMDGRWPAPKADPKKPAAKAAPADAPSVRYEALAAVTVPYGLTNAGLSEAIFSSCESPRTPCSSVLPSNGTISSS